jgi:pimeloyl-ACP methyl ester carboxylesterase
MTSRTFVLVHGGWHGGWCWRRVADALRARGHVVFTPTLTGLGERSHLLDAKVGLETHVRDVANVLEWEGLHDVVLVGHSYGGCVVSRVAEHCGKRLSAIVFLDAFVPENGQALVDLAVASVREAIEAADRRGELALAPYPAAYFGVGEGDRAWVDAKCTPHPIRTFLDKAVLTGARERIPKRVYIRATAYPSTTYDAKLARARQDSSWRTYEVPCGHDVMVDMPERLVEILTE